MSQLKDLAKGIKNGLFASRHTVEDAFEYVQVVAKGCGTNYTAVITAVMVMTNTIAKEVERLDCTDELVEALEAVQDSYILCTGSHQETSDMKRARTLVGLALQKAKGERP